MTATSSSRINRQILHIAVPAIISNITVPLLSLIDISIVGHLGSASYIGAIAIGGMLFNMIYWLFSFLRMGTSGLTAQAYGMGNTNESMRILTRSLTISLLMAAVLILLQYPIRLLAFELIDASEEVQRYAMTYFHICIWGAPAVLGLYSFSGWFIGMQNSKSPMYIALIQNLVNIGGSLCFVYVLDMKVEGVAWGTLIAQYAGLLMAILIWKFHYKQLHSQISFQGILEKSSMKRFFQVNRDIFLRTLCLVSVTVFFTSTGAAYGDVTLAVNTLLMQLFTLFSYIMDGFAYAGEALTGKYIGAQDRQNLHQTIRQLFNWGIGLALAFTLLYGIGGEGFLQLLTNEENVIKASQTYFLWALAIPLSGFSAFLLDGICIGATITSVMLRGMAAATTGFFAVYFITHDTLGNHSLWMAFITYLLLRGIIQGIWIRKYLP